MAITKVDLANVVTGVLPVANGGTGTSTGVAPGGSTTQVQYNNAGAFGGDSGFVYSGGSVGIGTSSPSGKLTVNTSSASLVEQLTLNNPDVNGAGSKISFRQGANEFGTITSKFVSGAWQLDLGTNSFDPTITLKSGNVGIGTSSPSTKLDVSGTSRYTFNVSNAYTLQTSINSAGSAFADDYKNALSHIWQTSGTERMRIDSSGNVGIGISSPSTKLQVDGNIEAIRNGSDTYIVVKETSSQNYAQGLILSDSATSWYVVNRYGGSPVGASGFGIGTTNLGEMLQLDTSANFYFNSGYGSSARAYGCRAWVNFNGSGGGIRGSGNVSSITVSGTGRYTVNMTTALPDANYSRVVAASGLSGDSNGVCANSDVVFGNSVTPSTTQFGIYLTISGQSGYRDSPYVSAAVFR